MTCEIEPFVEHHVRLRESLADRPYDSLPYITEVHTLKNHVTDLRRSPSDDIQAAIRRIDTTFAQNDSAARFEVSNKLRQPQRIYKMNIMEWIQRAPDDDVAVFCAWNLKRKLELESALRRDQQALSDDLLEKTEKLVSTGLFPLDAPSAMDRALKSTIVHVMDSFEGGGLGAAGLYKSWDFSVTFANLYDNRTDMTGIAHELTRVAFHEYMHAIGCFRGFDPVAMPGSPIEEAFVEHATTVAYADQPYPQIIIPSKRPGSTYELSVYHPERTLLGMAGIPADQLAETYFSSHGSEHGEKLRSELERKLGTFFGSIEKYRRFDAAHAEIPYIQRDKMVYDKIAELQGFTCDEMSDDTDVIHAMIPVSVAANESLL